MLENIEYYNNVFRVVRNLIEYKAYKESIQDALKVLNKKYSHVSNEENETAFKTVFEVYEKSVELIKKKEKKFWRCKKSNELDALIDEEINASLYSNVPRETLKLIFNFIFYYRFER